ncbi:tyrosinase [Fusarium sporotrichioides]|uniref:tyrosinase n=1 Tax=Fusarium sporotrichioides TaxID=5514 RepID=A0A395RUT4_FUSSP|nr:tyrosinase [Fusarium sporotrichioides]
MTDLRVRKDVRKLSHQERDNIVGAFKHIMELPPDDENSYFTIAGYHGLPEPQYCYHGVVLFPTWHRAYLRRLEEALRTAPGCEDLALPYWDEASNETKEGGIPRLFTDKTYRFQDGSSIPNPLRSYTLQKGIVDVEDSKNGKDTKPEGYQTVRYPYSGLVSDRFADRTKIHNSALNEKAPDEVTKILNDNVIRWLHLQKFQNYEEKWISSGEKDNYVNCLEAPNYTVFSNTTSAEKYNEENRGKPTVAPVVPIEQPHNAVHLAVGGFDVPGDKNHNVYAFANGDMGENDTAAFDPLFFFHHCFIDYIFWRWQDRHDKKENFEIMKGYPGTQLIKRGKAIANFTMDYPLTPFKTRDRVTGQERDTTSKDMVDISKLGYTYTEPGLFLTNLTAPAQRFLDAPKLKISGINRAKISGSFIVSVWAKTGEGMPDQLLQTKAVLSRWNVEKCGNCQSHLEVKSIVHLTDFDHEEALYTEFYAKVHTREKPEGLIFPYCLTLSVSLHITPSSIMSAATINTIPVELLSKIFICLHDDPNDGQKSIAQSRLVSRRFRDTASTFLITEVSVCLNSESFARFEAICVHPMFSKGVQKVNILLSYYEGELVHDKQLYMAEAESRVLRHWETMERSSHYKRRYNITTELFQWLGKIAWGNSSDVRQLITGEPLEAAPTPIQKLFLKTYEIYKARFDDQESLRKDNAHIGRLVNAISSLSGPVSLNLEDAYGKNMITRQTSQTKLGRNQLAPEDFSDTGYDRNILQHFDSAIRQSGWCGSLRTDGSSRHNGTFDISTIPPLEMLGEFCSELGEKGVRPRDLRISLKPPPNMRQMVMSSVQQENMKLLVSEASSLVFRFDFFARPHNLRENPRDEMLALCSVTKPFFSAPKLEFLDIYFMEYPGSRSSPTVSLGEILPLDMSWPRLEYLWLQYQPMTMDELKAVVSKHCATVRDLKLPSPWLLQGSVHDALKTIRGFENLENVVMAFPKGSDFRGTGTLDFKWPEDDIKRYLLKKTDVFPLQDELVYDR